MKEEMPKGNTGIVCGGVLGKIQNIQGLELLKKV